MVVWTGRDSSETVGPSAMLPRSGKGYSNPKGLLGTRGEAGSRALSGGQEGLIPQKKRKGQKFFEMHAVLDYTDIAAAPAAAVFCVDRIFGSFIFLV